MSVYRQRQKLREREALQFLLIFNEPLELSLEHSLQIKQKSQIFSFE